MCGNMVVIQFAAAEIRRGKERKTRMWANAQRDGRPAKVRRAIKITDSERRRQIMGAGRVNA